MNHGLERKLSASMPAAYGYDMLLRSRVLLNDYSQAVRPNKHTEGLLPEARVSLPSLNLDPQTGAVRSLHVVEKFGAIDIVVYVSPLIWKRAPNKIDLDDISLEDAVKAATTPFLIILEGETLFHINPDGRVLSGGTWNNPASMNLCSLSLGRIEQSYDEGIKFCSSSGNRLI
ncbi:MAG: hypothetical protein Q7R77_00220 [Candidatus Daviesbacteria bacterium]|nr:hypothetical protein [Candidatus Daviesbacteria bacterium]